MLDTLRQVPLFANLSDEQVQWIITHSEEIQVPVGTFLFKEGDAPPAFYILLTGALQITKHSGHDEMVLTNHHAGAFTGEIPLLTGTPYIASARVTEDAHLLCLTAQVFHDLLTVCPQVASMLLPTLASRLRTTDVQMQQHEKLTALGKMAAGLAHELNNPAAAGQRAASQVRAVIEGQRALTLQINACLSAEQLAALAQLQHSALEQAKNVPPLDSLAQSDLEETLTDWLDEHEVSDGWRLAPTLAGAGFDIQRLDALASQVDGDILAPVLAWLESSLAINELLETVEQSTTRISELVKAIKEYSYMDQAPQQEIDVHVGLESTLTILGHKLKHGVTVTREYDRSLPRICAHGSELNQVWTNLIDNAIDAMQGQGRLWVHTARDGNYVLVEIADSGSGIPPEIQPRIFEPFFTTKGVGEGTGLGLDTAYRIVVGRHHGDINVTSKPGATCFQVRLPIGGD